MGTVSRLLSFRSDESQQSQGLDGDGVSFVSFRSGAAARSTRARIAMTAPAKRIWVVTIALALGLSGAVVAEHDRAEWSPIVYPLQRLPLVFSHAKHLGRGTPLRRVSSRRGELAVRDR